MTHELFEPITIRGLEIRNRLWAAPMCQYMAEKEDGMPNAWHPSGTRVAVKELDAASIP